MSCKYYLASIFDSFLCLFVFFPLAIFHWRGTWGLQDVYFYPNNEELSGWLSLVIGAIGCVTLQFFQPILFHYFTPEHRCLYYFISRLFLYISGWLIMCYWRGVWVTLDYYFPGGWYSSTIIFGLAQIVALGTKTSRNNVGLPFSLAVDTDEEMLKSDTALKVKPTERLKYLGDVMFTQLICVTCNICVWRGIWNVLDDYMFSYDELLSDVASLVVGYVTCIQLFLLQWPAGVTSARLDDYPPWCKIMFEDIIMMASSVPNLLLWRGGWDLCVNYVIPDPLVGGWVSHWVGTIGLIAFQVFNSVAMNGVEIDGSYMNGEGVYPTGYIRHYWKHKIQKHVPVTAPAQSGDQEKLLSNGDLEEHSISDTGPSDDEFSVYALENNTAHQTATNL